VQFKNKFDEDHAAAAQLHQRIKTETDQFQTQQKIPAKPLVLQKPATAVQNNNFFTEVALGSSGLSQYQTQPSKQAVPKQPPRKTSAQAQHQNLSYDNYSKLMQQLIKDSSRAKQAITKATYRKASTSSRSRTKSHNAADGMNTSGLQSSCKYYD